MALTLPQSLPDGSCLMADSDFEHRLHYGDATVGWAGDERLGTYFADGCIEIRRLCEDGDLRLIMRSKPGHRFLNTETLRFLAEHDSQSRRAYDVAEDVNQRNAANQRAKDAAAKDKIEEAADRIHYGLIRDIGHVEGGSTKRLIQVPGRRDR